ncbi:MAG TPA: hypothetical protein VFQ80_11010 [Thermomicrobiales bacterium]|nr:hypothetical protein [Thermomicrobiales bacterium]
MALRATGAASSAPTSTGERRKQRSGEGTAWVPRPARARRTTPPRTGSPSSVAAAAQIEHVGRSQRRRRSVAALQPLAETHQRPTQTAGDAAVAGGRDRDEQRLAPSVATPFVKNQRRQKFGRDPVHARLPADGRHERLDAPFAAAPRYTRRAIKTIYFFLYLSLSATALYWSRPADGGREEGR